MEEVLVFSGRRLRKRRRELEISQKELARMVGVAPRAVFAWEHGEKAPRADNLGKLAVVLKVDPNFFYENVAQKSDN